MSERPAASSASAIVKSSARLATPTRRDHVVSLHPRCSKRTSFKLSFEKKGRANSPPMRRPKVVLPVPGAPVMMMRRLGSRVGHLHMLACPARSRLTTDIRIAVSRIAGRAWLVNGQLHALQPAVNGEPSHDRLEQPARKTFLSNTRSQHNASKKEPSSTENSCRKTEK